MNEKLKLIIEMLREWSRLISRPRSKAEWHRLVDLQHELWTAIDAITAADLEPDRVQVTEAIINDIILNMPPRQNFNPGEASQPFSVIKDWLRSRLSVADEPKPSYLDHVLDPNRSVTTDDLNRARQELAQLRDKAGRE